MNQPKGRDHFRSLGAMFAGGLRSLRPFAARNTSTFLQTPAWMAIAALAMAAQAQPPPRAHMTWKLQSLMPSACTSCRGATVS